MRTLIRKAAGFLVACAFIGAASLMLTETAVRAWMPQEAPSLWLTPNARYGHLMKPDFAQDYPFPRGDFVMKVRTNSMGFRDKEPGPREEGVPTIVFSGDSFTFGHGIDVEQRFDTLFEAKLKAAGKKVRCINLGVNAWGTLQETRYLTDHLDEMQPDVVVLTFCENDPHDDGYFLEHGISFDRVRFPGKDFLRLHFHTFRLLQHSYLVWRKSRLLQAVPKQEVAVEGKTASNEPPMKSATPAIREDQWQRTRGYIEEFMSAWRARNAKARLLLQATDPMNDSIRKHLSTLASSIPGVEYVDLAESAARLSPEDRRLPFDGHWSPAMHEVSAEALAGVMAR